MFQFFLLFLFAARNFGFGLPVFVAFFEQELFAAERVQRFFVVLFVMRLSEVAFYLEKFVETAVERKVFADFDAGNVVFGAVDHAGPVKRVGKEVIGLDNQAEVFELVYFGKIGLFAAVLNGDLMMYGKFGSGNRIAVFVPGQNDADEPGGTDAGLHRLRRPPVRRLSDLRRGFLRE